MSLDKGKNEGKFRVSCILQFIVQNLEYLFIDWSLGFLDWLETKVRGNLIQEKLNVLDIDGFSIIQEIFRIDILAYCLRQSGNCKIFFDFIN